MLKEHRDNLAKLADYLENLPDDYAKFDMEFFMSADGEPIDTPKTVSCGTVACAVGHGPSAGIPVCGDNNWPDYVQRVFGVYHARESGAFEWLFAEWWASVDNTPKGAANRIRYYLENGVPHEDSYLWDNQDF
jgi:hypothetical protein